VDSFFVGVARAVVVSAAFSVVSFGIVPFARGEQPSFNCKTDTAPDESTICASSALSQLDRQLNDLFVAVRDGLDANQQIQLRDAERIWLRQRAACGRNASCIAGLYQARIGQLRSIIAGAPGVPQAPIGTPVRPPVSSGTGDACDAFPTLC